MSERVNFAERVRFANEIGRLEEENGKLRELCRELWMCASADEECEPCSYTLDVCPYYSFADRLQKLGVEV